LTLSTAGQGLISSLRNYNEPTTAPAQADKDPHSPPPAGDLILDHPHPHPPPHSPSLPPPVVLTCLRCHGTVEGPKYSTCTCAIPSVLQAETEISASAAPVPAANSLQQHFWKGVYDTKHIFNAAVNIFHPKKSGELPVPREHTDHPHSHPDPAAAAAPPPLTDTTAMQSPPQPSAALIASSEKGDSDDEDIGTETAESEAPVTTTQSVSSIFPLVSESAALPQEDHMQQAVKEDDEED
jgi:hypothetical protein